MGVWYQPPNQTFIFFPSLPRVPRGVSMETRTRQRSVSQPKVHPVWEGGSSEILQQAGCKRDDAVGFSKRYTAITQKLAAPRMLQHTVLLFMSSPVQARDPKAVMKIETLNATFQPAKIGNPCGLQITYLKDNSTRNIFVYHSDAKVCAHTSFYDCTPCFLNAPCPVLDYSNTRH